LELAFHFLSLTRIQVIIRGTGKSGSRNKINGMFNGIDDSYSRETKTYSKDVSKVARD
jgi:hypothetical protein